MQRQITVRLTEELAASLQLRAQTTGEKPSEIVRAALHEHLQIPKERPGKRIDRVRRLIGALESGQTDLAERHREYILESLLRGR